MFIDHILLENYRNYTSLDIHLFNDVNIFYGNNAQGKTNLLESIYYLSFTKSHRSFIDNNLTSSRSVPLQMLPDN